MNKILAILAPLLLAACARNTAPEADLEPVPEPARFTAGVPIELVRYGTGNATFRDDLPPGFPAFELPPELNVLGSMVGADGRQSVAFAVEGSAGDAAATLRETLLGTGWGVYQELSGPLSRRQVFVRAEDVRAAASRGLCHPELGLLRIEVEEAPGLLSLHLDVPPGQRGQIQCGPPPIGLANAAGLERLLPTLRPSEGMVQGISGGGSTSEHSASARIRSTTLTLRRLADEFAEQMAQQGWQRDAQWRSRLAAGSTWTHPAEGDRRALATLDIRPVEEGFDVHFDIRFVCDDDCDLAEADLIPGPPIGIRGIPISRNPQ